MPGVERRTIVAAAWITLAAAAAFSFFAADFPPLVDLPQHEALVSILRDWNVADCGYPAIYQIDRFSPYWLGYLLAWGLSLATGIDFAFRILLALAVVGLPLATARLLRAGGGDPAWALLVFPFAFGAATAWGFFGFLIAAPLGLLLLATAFALSRRPSPGRGAALALGLVLLFFAHLLTFGLTVAIAAALLFFAPGRRMPRLATLLPATALALGWLVALRERANGAPPGFRLGWSLDRLFAIANPLFGVPTGSWPTLALLALAALFVAAFRPRWSREPERFLPVAIVATVVVAAPAKILGTALMPERFSLFLVPALLFALDRRPERPPSRRSVAAIAAAALALVLVFDRRFAVMDREGRGLTGLLRGAPAGERLLYLPFDRASSISSDPVFAYAGARYAVGRCGVVEPSFASYGHYPIRFRGDGPSREPALPPFVEFVPQRFRYDRHGGERFGLFLFRSTGEPPLDLVLRGGGALELLATSGPYRLYRNRGATGSPPSGRP